MTIQRTNLLALLTAALLALGAATAQAQETVRIAVPDHAGAKETTDFVLPIGQPTDERSFIASCMTANGFGGDAHPVQRVVVINNEDSPAATLIGGDFPAYLEFDLPPGTRLVNLNKVHEDCAVDFVNYDIFEAEIAGPQNSEVAMVLTPSDSLTADHEAVVKGGTDEFGIADSVCIKKGEKPMKTELLCDVELLPGDRLTKFVEVDYDPETGETMYACWLEY